MIPTLIRVVEGLFTALYIMLFVRILLSWFPGARGQMVVLLHRCTEPFLAPIRRVIARSPLGGPGMFLDFSPIFAFLLMFLLRDFIIAMLLRL